jgi:ribosomal protein S18 acetylase RimI-like enzyme
MDAWVLDVREGPEGLPDFVMGREWRCCFYSSRLPGSRGFKPGRKDAHAFLSKGGIIEAAVCFGRDGSVLPVLEGKGAEGARNAIASLGQEGFEAARVLGLRDDVLSVESVIGPPKDAIDHFLMRREEPSPAPENKPVPGMETRVAAVKDAEALLPLQEAYEREEVLIPLHAFNARAISLALAESLRSQTVLVVEIGGRIVAKAQTNARGFFWDQLGGIYVSPEWRRRGIGAFITSQLARRIEGEGRQACLFVKKSNIRAIRAYERSGFSRACDYRIAYYS